MIKLIDLLKEITEGDPKVGTGKKPKRSGKAKTQRLNKLNELDISKYISSWVDTKQLKRFPNFPEAIFLSLKKEGYTNKGEIYRVITLDPLVVIIKQNTEYIDLDKFLEDNQDIEPYDDLYSTYQDEKEVIARLDSNFSFEDIYYASSMGMNMNPFLKNLDKNKLKNDILKKDQGKLLSFSKDRDAINDIFYTSINNLDNDDIEEYDVESKQDIKEFIEFIREYVSQLNENEINEAEYHGRKVQLGKPMQGDIKKSKVYVKNPKGKVVKVNFGFGGKSAHGKRMVIKKNNPKRRAAYRSRHNCDNPGPRWKANYWSCRAW